MQLNQQRTDDLISFFREYDLLPGNAPAHLEDISKEGFVFREQLSAAESIHLHIKVPDVAALPHNNIVQQGGEPQNPKEGYIKYAFPDGLNFIFSSIPVSQEEKSGVATFAYPHLDHIGIDIRDERQEAYDCFNAIPHLAEEQHWPSKRQGGDGKKVYCCHVQVNEKYWVYPPGSVYWEFAFGELLVSKDVFGCDLRPANPALGLPEQTAACCGSEAHTDETTESVVASSTYYNPADLKKFSSISELQPGLGKRFFDYYGEVFRDGALTAREKSLIALAVAHAVQCPYCIDAYTADTIAKEYTKAQQMEAVHVAAAIRSGATLVHGVQMMNKINATI